MPMIDADGCLLNVSVEGRDGGPTLMLSNSLGSDHADVEPQMKALTQVFRVIRYDRRGHGKSERAARALFDGAFRPRRAGDPRRPQHRQGRIGAACRWAAWSGNGWAPTRPSRFGKIILANTACHYPDPTNWHNRIKAVKEGGIAAVADTVIAGWLTADFREREPQIAGQHEGDAAGHRRCEGYLACCEALVARSTSASCCRRSKARRW